VTAVQSPVIRGIHQEFDRTRPYSYARRQVFRVHNEGSSISGLFPDICAIVVHVA
jgi:hypothetical protein